MLFRFCVLLAGLMLGNLAFGDTPANDDWCTIDGPKEVVVGKPFDVTVKLKDPKTKTKLAVDIYWMKPDGNFGGFLIYSPRRDEDKAATETFTFTVDPKPGMASVYAGAYLSPDGNDDHQTATKNGPEMPIAGFTKPQKPADVHYNKSWISVHPIHGPFHSNQSYDITVDYYLDPSEAWGGQTTISLDLLGPWIDCPDSKYTKERHHVPFPGTGFTEQPVTAGKGSVTFHAKIEQLLPRTSVIIAATFHDANGEGWPWSVRAAGPEFIYTQPNYELHTAQPGNLFTYDEPVVVQIAFREGATAGQIKTLKYTLVDVNGKETPGHVDFNSDAPGKTCDVTIPVDARGTFLLEGEVDGWGKRELVFARIPDVAKATGGKPTQFAATDLTSELESKVAHKLGFSACRHFASWKTIEPGPDVWTYEYWDHVFKWNRDNGITPWVCLTDPPAWIQGEKPTDVGYTPFPFDEAAWKSAARAMSEHWKDAILGFEWQNEIVPGSLVTNPVQNYLSFCRIGTTEAKAVNPGFTIIQAGGLWPRNYRQDLLAAGNAANIDVLPVHYSDLNGVLDARDDLDRVGAKQVRVWDDETSNGLSTWDMPSREMLKVTSQSQWALRHWPDELIAGAERVTAFAGPADTAGNWSYLIGPDSPRPYATTIAVLISKLATAKPLGKFYLDGGVFWLFERDGKALLVAASAQEDNKADVRIAAGANLSQTDYQGVESDISVDKEGSAQLGLGSMPVFLEGGDLDTLKSNLVLAVGDARRPSALPGIVALKSAMPAVSVQVTNPFDHPMRAQLVVEPDNVRSTSDKFTEMKPDTLAPGEKTVVDVPLVHPVNGSGEMTAIAAITLDGRKPLIVQSHFLLNLIDPSMLSNLAKNGNFEEANPKKPDHAASWHGDETVKLAPSEGAPGLGDHFIRMEGSKGYMQMYQEIPVPGGQSYLYTAWIQSHDMEGAGSNMGLGFSDKKSETLYTPSVFDVGGNTPSWRLVAKQIDTPPDLNSISLTPIAEGKGYALFDNIRLTIYQGTKYAAEAHHVDKPPTLDGDLSGWNKECPIPLLGDNQLTAFDPSYKWSPEKLSGAAYLEWDKDALYFAADVIDNTPSASFTDDRTLESDSIVLALDPSNRAAGHEAGAFAYYISAASPGGGSGKFTLYRPPAHAGGLPSGQLARDSSVYEVFIKHDGNRTIYEVKLPWSQLGGIAPAEGTRVGLSLQLNDNDGHNRAACMTWGDGLQPSWNPGAFGVLTLVP